MKASEPSVMAGNESVSTMSGLVVKVKALSSAKPMKARRDHTSGAANCAMSTRAVITITGGGGMRPSTRTCLDMVATRTPRLPMMPLVPGNAMMHAVPRAMPTITWK